MDLVCTPDAGDGTASGVLAEYGHWLDRQRGLAPITVHNYCWNVERFLAALPTPPVVPDPADRIADRDDEHLIALRAAIADARPADSTLLAMTALEGFTIGEAATALGLSESAAKMRLSRLRARLRTAVAAQPLPEGGS